MSRATVDLQSVRFFLGYGLIFFFQHLLTIVGRHRRPLPRRLEARARRDWRSRRCSSSSPTGTRRSRIPFSATSNSGWPTWRPSPRRTSSASTSSSRSPRRRARPRSSSERTESLFRRSLDANRQRALYVPLLSFLPLVAQATVLLYGGRMVASGELALDSFFAFNVLVLMLVMPLRMLGMWIGQAQRATASGERIFEVIDESEDVRDAAGARDLPAGRRAGRLRGCRLRLHTGPARARGRRPRDRAGRDCRADRPHRVGQDDAGLARAAVLRRDRVGGSRSTARTSATSGSPRCGARSGSSPRTRFSSRRPSGRTSPSARPARRTRT